MAEKRVGDTARTDKEPALVDTSGEVQVKTEGDKQVPGYVSEPLTNKSDPPDGPTGDIPRTDKEPALVETPDPPKDQTPNEHAKTTGTPPPAPPAPAAVEAKAVTASPENK